MTEDKITVDKGIPIPKGRGRGRPAKYPWAEMVVGDSFFVPRATVRDTSGCVSVRTRKYRGEKYTSRSENGGVRVWKIAEETSQ